MRDIAEAILNGASGEALAAMPLPSTHRAAVIRRADQEMFAGVDSKDKDPRRSVHIDEVPLPELAPDEAVIAVMASSMNFNTVWSTIFEPVSTFVALGRLGRESSWAKRHDIDHQQIGSDAAGVVLRAA